MFPNPVSGPIHPASWVRPTGNLEFEVTSYFGPRTIDGVSSVHKGLDIGNGRGGANVLAQAAGTVVEYRPTTDGVVTIQTADKKWRLVAAHMTSIVVRLGTAVSAGQVIGQVGKVGAAANHLHFENKELVNGVYIARDPWALLNQNAATGGDNSMTIVTYTPFPEGPRTWSANTTKTYTGYKPDGTTKSVALNAGSNAPASGTAVIQQNPQKAPNGSGFVLISAGVLAGYYMVPADGTVAPPPPAPPSGGFTQADLDAARKDGAQLAAKEAAKVAAAL